MKHVKIVAFNISDAWYKVVDAIWHQGEHFNVGNGSEEGDTLKLDVTIHITNPDQLPIVNDKAPTDMKHVQLYGLEYLYTDFLREHPYTYGWRLLHPVDQKAELIKAILKNPNNRQLTMTIRIPEDVTNKEPPCLTMIDIEVKDGKVNMTCYFRSWDAYGALNENIGGIFLYLQALVSDINDVLIAEGRPDSELLETGQMIFHSKNCHIYKRCYPFVEKMFAKSDEEKRHNKIIIDAIKNHKSKPYHEFP